MVVYGDHGAAEYATREVTRHHVQGRSVNARDCAHWRRSRISTKWLLTPSAMSGHRERAV